MRAPLPLDENKQFAHGRHHGLIFPRKAANRRQAFLAEGLQLVLAIATLRWVSLREGAEEIGTIP